MLIGALVSGGALALVFSQVNLGEFAAHLRQADGRFIVGMMLVYLMVIVLRAVRWQALVSEPMQFGQASRIINVSYLLNTVLPLRVGEIARVWLMGRTSKQSAASGLSALTLERLLDLSFALLCVGLGLILLPLSSSLSAETTSTLGLMLIVTVIGIVAVIALSRTHRPIMRVLHLMVRPLPTGLAARLTAFADDLLSSLQTSVKPGRLLKSALWSLLLWAGYVSYYQLGLAGFMPTTPSLGVGLLVVGFIALGGAAPSLPGAVGIFQAAAVLALTLNHYDASLATSYAWGVWVPQTVMVIFAGAVSAWGMGLSLTHLTRSISMLTACDQ
jgi:hypothetical protein